MSRGTSLEDLMVQQRMTNRLLVALMQKASPSRFNVSMLCALLAGIGATVNEIADAIGTTPGTVGVSLSRLKKTNKRGKANAQGPRAEAPEEPAGDPVREVGTDG